MTYHNEILPGKFMFGASYAPYAKGEDWPMEEWESDLIRMKEMSFNTIRIFATWSRIEPLEDQYDFGPVDYMFELAEKHDMKIILCLGGLFGNSCGISRPWYLRDLEDYCNDHPLVEERTEKFLRRTILRYRDKEQLIGWMIWNEPNAIPHCKCRHTVRYFQNWLKEKYKSVEALNRAWNGGEPLFFTSFEQITGVNGESLAATLDFERFNQFNLCRQMRRIHDLCYSLDPKHRFTTFNSVNPGDGLGEGTTALRIGLNIDREGQTASIFGISHYYAEHPFNEQPAWRSAFIYARQRSASCDVHRRTLVLETGAGPNLAQLDIPRRNAFLWQMIAHNVKGILMWNYRSRVDGRQVALFHMMAFDGSPAARGTAVAHTAALFQKHENLLNAVYPHADVAVFMSEDALLLQHLNYDPETATPLSCLRTSQSRYGAYKLLWDMNVTADVVTEWQLDRLSDYKAVLMPLPEQITPAIAEALRAYVRQGGTVLAEGPAGFLNEEGRLIYRAPGYGLDEVFGCWLNDRENTTAGSPIVLNDGTQVSACDFFSILHPTTAKVIGRYADGSGAAITVNAYGKGRVLFAGTEILRQVSVNPQPALISLMRNLLLEVGVLPDIVVQGDTEAIEAVRLCSEDGEKVLNLLINHAPQAKHFHIELRDACELFEDLCTEKTYPGIFEVTMTPYQVLALQPKA